MNAQIDPRYMGRYELATASRWVGMTKDRVRRWVRGYQYQTSRDPVKQPPVIAGPSTNEPYVNFLDLIRALY